MKAAVFHKPGDIRVDNVPDPEILDPRDVILKVTSTAICGSDLHILSGAVPQKEPLVMGHEFMGFVEEVGSGITNLKKGDRVVLTKRGRPRAVLVNYERYALLEDLAWVLQDPGRQAALHQAWSELQRGKLIRPPQRGPLTVRILRDLARRPSRRRARV